MIGDVVGDPGLEALERRLPGFIEENSIDFTVVNGENAAGGFGLTATLLERIFTAGADIVTGGNHIWEKREFWPTLDAEARVIRPMNYPNIYDKEEERIPGRGAAIIEKPGPLGQATWIVVNLQGREFMSPIDCPFKTFDDFESILKDMNLKEKPIILIDFHAESSGEKEALAYYLDGRVTVLAGTHTHVQTSDERLLPLGSAYITDLGMTGTLDGVIGMDTKICLERARNQVLYRMEVAAPGKETGMQGIIAEIDFETGKALSIKRISF